MISFFVACSGFRPVNFIVLMEVEYGRFAI